MLDFGGQFGRNLDGKLADLLTVLSLEAYFGHGTALPPAFRGQA